MADDRAGGISPRSLQKQTIRRRLIAVAMAAEDPDRLTPWFPTCCVLPRNEMEIVASTEKQKVALMRSLAILDGAMKHMFEKS